MKNHYLYNGRVIRISEHDYSHACVRDSLAVNKEVYVVSCNKNKELAEAAKRREAKEINDVINDYKKELEARANGKTKIWWLKDVTIEQIKSEIEHFEDCLNSLKVVEIQKM